MVGATLSACDVNAVPRQDEAVKAAWSQVLNLYQRRSDQEWNDRAARHARMRELFSSEKIAQAILGLLP